VDDAERVRLGNGLASLQDEVDGLLVGERASSLNPGSEVFALQVIHHHVGGAGLKRADAEDASHVLALDLDRSSRFAREAVDRLAIFQHLGEEELDSDLLIEPDIWG
jgi:hypothetical protein